MCSYHKSKSLKIALIIILMFFVCCNLTQSQHGEIPMETKTTNKTVKKKKPKYHTIESKLSKKTRKLIKKIKKCEKDVAKFKGYNEKTYDELTKYLYSKYHICYEDGILITDVKRVKKRIKSVEHVNQILYERVKKIYKGKNLKTIKAFHGYIEWKITYKLKNPDMYKSMKRGSCVAYSTMLKVMCDICDIPCRIYAGWRDPENGHCWNRIKIKGKWYWSDACWFDNSMYDYDDYLYSRKLWWDHLEYKPLYIYDVSLPY